MQAISHAACLIALMAIALLTTSMSFERAAARARIPDWIPLAVFGALGAASLTFHLLFPKTIALFGQV
jgi:hypothetical protein